MPPKLETSITLDGKNIAELINVDDCIECIARTPAFITLKVHKLEFHQNLSCRLNNPATKKLGKVNKLVIDKIIKKRFQNFISANGRKPVQF